MLASSDRSGRKEADKTSGKAELKLGSRMLMLTLNQASFELLK